MRKMPLLGLIFAFAACANIAQAQQITNKHFIFEAESRLKVAGFLSVSAPNDGIVGPRTHTAIRQYQQAYGMDADGILTVQLLLHMRGVRGAAVVPRPQNPETVEYTDVDDIRAVQQLLVEHGYSLTVDGVVGDSSRQAVADFESRQGDMMVDGLLNPRLLRRLQAQQASVAQLSERATYMIACSNSKYVGQYIGVDADVSAAKDKAYAKALSAGFNAQDCSDGDY